LLFAHDSGGVEQTIEVLCHGKIRELGNWLTSIPLALRAPIEQLEIEIKKASEAIAKAVKDRRAANKDSPLTLELNIAIVAARQALNDVEVKMRKLYESKDD